MEAKLVVTVLGILLIILLNWYFFFSRTETASAKLKDRKIKLRSSKEAL